MQCASDGSCKICSQGRSLVGGACLLADCRIECEICTEGCAKCNYEKCFKCEVHRVIVDGKCECNAGLLLEDGECVSPVSLEALSEDRLRLTLASPPYKLVSEEDLSLASDIVNDWRLMLMTSRLSTSYSLKTTLHPGARLR
mmetsp:Transcript_13175/g.24660  ORF Transcript_13175/g.24660 Transcript_13175/m.24660 type:complete len:142 (-) Transcript_13175:1183-1608(-)